MYDGDLPPIYPHTTWSPKYTSGMDAAGFRSTPVVGISNSLSQVDGSNTRYTYPSITSKVLGQKDSSYLKLYTASVWNFMSLSSIVLTGKQQLCLKRFLPKLFCLTGQYLLWWDITGWVIIIGRLSCIGWASLRSPGLEAYTLWELMMRSEAEDRKPVPPNDGWGHWYSLNVRALYPFFG